MLVELGHYALILALLLAAAQAFFGLAGPALRRERWIEVAPSAAVGQFTFVAIAVAILVNAFVQDNFSVRYVAENSNSALPLFYRVTALWGAHEGSMLLWILVLSLWTIALVARMRTLPRPFAARALGVLGVLSFGFLLYSVTTSDPFVRLFPAPPDGNSLNPLLQDPAFAVHPPVLYAGYVGFAVTFALACAAMIEGRRDQLWARWMRPWTVSAWAFLTCGIALGSWWSYYQLGWGGFWFWDPVENASFMPWLVAAALIHSLAVTDKRGLFKSWTLLLSVTVFSLSLLGTFLVRSGVLISVHSFAAAPNRGIFILCFLLAVIGTALLLYAWRAPLMRSAAGFDPLSRESFLLFNNILLVIAAAVVFAGTMAPMIAGALGLGTVSVGPPYFNPSFLLPVLPLLALLAVGMHARWRRGGLSGQGRVLLWALGAAVLLAVTLTFGVYGHPLPLAPIGVALGAWIMLSALIDPLNRLRRRLSLPASILGMSVAHFGVGLFVLSISIVQSNTLQRDVALKIGQSAPLGAYRFHYVGGRDVVGPNYEAYQATIRVSRHGQLVTVLRPEKRNYWVQGTVQAKAAIDARWNRNLLVALGDDVGSGAWSMRLQYRPLIDFIWFGALVMALGGAISVIGGRRLRAMQAAQLAGEVSAPAMPELAGRTLARAALAGDVTPPGGGL